MWSRRARARQSRPRPLRDAVIDVLRAVARAIEEHDGPLISITVKQVAAPPPTLDEFAQTHPLNRPPDDHDADGEPLWFQQGAFQNDGTVMTQPIDPTDSDWPDPTYTNNADRIAFIAPGTDLLAEIRATPTPGGPLAFPILDGERDDL